MVELKLLGPAIRRRDGKEALQGVRQDAPLTGLLWTRSACPGTRGGGGAGIRIGLNTLCMSGVGTGTKTT